VSMGGGTRKEAHPVNPHTCTGEKTIAQRTSWSPPVRHGGKQRKKSKRKNPNAHVHVGRTYRTPRGKGERSTRREAASRRGEGKAKREEMSSEKKGK